jgi:hypothetical protein
VPEAEVPERLRRLNFVFFREGQSFARPLRELAAALRQDVEWIREHTRLSEAAARWQARDRGAGAANDLLLRGDDLADAKAWVTRRKDNAPAITALLTAFLTASEERAAALADQERERLAERGTPCRGTRACPAQCQAAPIRPVAGQAEGVLSLP